MINYLISEVRYGMIKYQISSRYGIDKLPDSSSTCGIDILHRYGIDKLPDTAVDAALINYLISAEDTALIN